LIRRVTDAEGGSLFEHAPEVFRPVIPRATARRLGAMMERTVTRGTARSAFFDEHGAPFLPGIRVAGKTGSLTGESPYRAYSWWVGFAPADRPRIAVAALVVNTPRWRIKASYVARETLRQYLVRR
jgi:cell division protein FtsI/penicillin-binding protein 2